MAHSSIKTYKVNSIDPKVLERQTLLISTFIHFLIFPILSFTFSAEAPLKKPVYVFWGSILDKPDFDSMSTRNLSSKTRDIPPLFPNNQRQAFGTDLDKHILKPPYTKKLYKSSKIILKTTFLNTIEMLEQKKEKPFTDLEIKSNIPPRIPLKLDLNDKNRF